VFTESPRQDSGSRLEGSPITVALPVEWCRRILGSLRQRKTRRRSAGEMETLLSYFIELNPTVETFPALLAQYVGDPRSGIASAAGVLQRAWQRTRTTATVPADLPLAEVLRTLGALLDDSEARAGLLALARDRPRLHMFAETVIGGDLAHQTLGLLELSLEIAARTALRGQMTPRDPTAVDRFETRLRAVGVELDAEPPQSYEILLTERTIVVEGTAGYYRVCTSEGLAPQLRTLIRQRNASTDGQAES
jgi:hypothetical protein